ncbi:ABC transporter ATP-binding protein [Mycoplasma simbae]|uniref:ABC transporter ATP-binding protein n=1 Tax=Mycoplasma simbae TaxID=36744 RepID=UPI0004963F9C|nr:ABC transporter ATP-binding protein [Mycoplasma simbae]
MKLAIQFKNVNKYFKNKKTQFQALNNVSFDVKSGQFHGFIGANGAGKTTLIRTLLGFYPGYTGEIYIDGVDVKNEKVKERIGYIPEVATFPVSLSILEYLKEMAILSGIDSKDAKGKCEEQLSKLNLEKEFWSRKGKDLSSGQQKKVLLAQALINSPDLLILDEPAANLDPKARVELYETLHRLNKDKHITIFISSHILSELEQYIDSYTVLDKGQVKESTTIEQKRKEAKDSYRIVSDSCNKIIDLIEQNKEKYSIIYSLKDEKSLVIECESEIFKKLSILIIQSGIEVEYIGKNSKTLNEIYFDAKAKE